MPKPLGVHPQGISSRVSMVGAQPPGIVVSEPFGRLDLFGTSGPVERKASSTKLEDWPVGTAPFDQIDIPAMAFPHLPKAGDESQVTDLESEPQVTDYYDTTLDFVEGE